jgi:hypothetical protein
MSSPQSRLIALRFQEIPQLANLCQAVSIRL